MIKGLCFWCAIKCDVFDYNISSLSCKCKRGTLGTSLKGTLYCQSISMLIWLLCIARRLTHFGHICLVCCYHSFNAIVCCILKATHWGCWHAHCRENLICGCIRYAALVQSKLQCHIGNSMQFLSVADLSCSIALYSLCAVVKKSQYLHLNLALTVSQL